MRKYKKLSSKQLYFLAMIKYEFEMISKIMVAGLPFLIMILNLMRNESTKREDLELLQGLLITSILVLLQSTIFLILLRRFRHEIGKYLGA